MCVTVIVRGNCAVLLNLLNLFIARLFWGCFGFVFGLFWGLVVCGWFWGCSGCCFWFVLVVVLGLFSVCKT